ncbi:MAG: trans-sulfuration enzyme family protein [Stenotrophobium sp.]
MNIETLAVHSGRHIDGDSGAIAPVLNLSTTFERAGDGSYPHGHVYGRVSNPNRLALEQCLAELEGGTTAAAFPSGSAAVLAVMQALAPGDHVIIPQDLYWGTAVILRDLLTRWGLRHDTVDQTDLAAVASALRPQTRLVWVESPSNPLMKLVDLRRIAACAHDAGAWCAVDNTFATPVLQRPLELGADLVMHSTTKYLGGHSDIIGGAVIARENNDLFARVRDSQTKGGAIPSPFDCWLLLRSISTLPLRVRAQSANALRVAEFLAAHPKVAAVHYPGLATHPQHALALQQMRSGGAMLSVQIRGGRDAALAVTANVHLFTRATSLGGVESLIEHRASVEGPGTRTPENLLRLSIGLEHADDLIADLRQALA